MLATQPEGLPAAALGELLRRAGRVSFRAEALRARAIAEAERTGAAREQGFRSTTEWLSALTGEPVPVVRGQVAIAEALEHMPATREAFSVGQVSPSRVKMLAQAQALAPEQFAAEEAALVARVAAAPAGQVPQVLAAWKLSTDPDAAEGEVARLHTMRALHLSPVWSGMVHLSGDLDPAGGLIVLEALRSLSEGAALDSDDTRTPAQARADTLVEVCRRYAQADDKGKSRAARVLVTIPWSALRRGEGVVDTEAGPVGGGTARRLTCDATISRVLLDPQSIPIEKRRATRVVPGPLRRVLELRDGGCTHPGCRVPARWCDAHHITHWAEGGATDLANLRLLCSRHHTMAHQDGRHPRRE